MSWQDELRLRDLDDAQVIEATCLHCLHTWRLSPVQLMLQTDHRDLRLSEVAPNLACSRFGCKQIGARLTLIRQDDVSSFVGGMP